MWSSKVGLSFEAKRQQSASVSRNCNKIVGYIEMGDKIGYGARAKRALGSINEYIQ